jgi:gas vesicle protein
MITKTLKFSGGVLLGLGIGTVTALLLAPQSGDLSKDQIRARLDEIMDAGRRAQQETEDELHSRWEAVIAEGAKDPHPEITVTDRSVIKAEQAMERERERQETARREAQRLVERASKDLDKARKKL